MPATGTKWLREIKFKDENFKSIFKKLSKRGCSHLTLENNNANGMGYIFLINTLFEGFTTGGMGMMASLKVTFQGAKQLFRLLYPYTNVVVCQV